MTEDKFLSFQVKYPLRRQAQRFSYCNTHFTMSKLKRGSNTVSTFDRDFRSYVPNFCYICRYHCLIINIPRIEKKS